MEHNDIARLFEAAEAILTNTHVVYTSGRHGAAYVNKDALFLHPRITEQLCGAMAEAYDANTIDVVAGPTVGGVILAQWVAWELSRRRSDGSEVLAVFAEEDVADGVKQRVFRRGYDEHIRGKRVVVVEDILTTGGSARLVIESVRQLSAEVVGLSVLCNRGNLASQDLGNVPLHALMTLPLESYPAEECPLCQTGVPINTRVGKGRAFLARQV